MMIRTWAPIGAAVSVCVLSGAALAATINVPADQPTIAAAVASAVNGDEVVLADGVYTGASNRNVNFSGRAITVRSASGDPSTCIVDVQNAGFAFAVTGITTGEGAIEGLTIRNGTGTSGRGGGVFAQNAITAVRNCVFESCDVTTGGGAIFATQRSLTVEDCVFDTNSATSFGGAIEVFNAITVTIDRCVFLNNSASVGGGIEFGQGSNSQVANSLFVGNTASGARFGFAGYGGGGIVVVNGAVSTISNSTFVDNTTDHIAGNDGGGGVYSLNSTTNVHNSVFWNNSDLSGVNENGQLKRSGGILRLEHSLVEGLTGVLGGMGNIDSDPLFADAGAGDYRPTATSPTIDAANNLLVAAFSTADLDNAARFADVASVPDTGVGPAPVVDMGAYEAPANIDCVADLNNDGMVGSNDLARLLAGWGGNGPADLDGNGSVGSSDLAIMLAAWGPC